MPKFGKKKKNKADDALTSDFDFPSEDEDSDSDDAAEEGIPGLEIMDEEGQETLAEPLRYMAVRGDLPLNIRSELDSEQIGQLARGDVVLVTHTNVQAGRLRLRCQKGSPLPGKGAACGWVSAIEGPADTENENEGSLNLLSEHQRLEAKCYTVVAEHASVRTGPGADDPRAKFTLTEGLTFECLEVNDSGGHAAMKFKVGDSLEGWTAEKAASGAVWCEAVGFVDAEGDKILKKLAQEKQKQDQAEAKAKAAVAAAEAKAKAAQEKAGAKVKTEEAKAAAEEAKVAKKQLDRERKEVRAFEAKLAALVETAASCGGEGHPLDAKTVDLLQQAAKKIADQTAEWEAAAEEDDEEGGGGGEEGEAYVVLAKSTVRTGPDGSSEKVGDHKQGTTIIVCEQKLSNAEGLAVVRTSTAPAGWLKLKTSKGKTLLEKKKA